MKNFLKPVNRDQKKQVPISTGKRPALKASTGSKPQQGENLLLKFMRGLSTIQMERLTPLSFFTTLLFMVFVIIMMKYCSEVLVTFLQVVIKAPSFLK